MLLRFGLAAQLPATAPESVRGGDRDEFRDPRERMTKARVVSKLLSELR